MVLEMWGDACQSSWQSLQGNYNTDSEIMEVGPAKHKRQYITCDKLGFNSYETLECGTSNEHTSLMSHHHLSSARLPES